MGQDWTRPFRFSLVPWLSDRMDLRPMGRPEAVCKAEDDSEIAFAWHVPRPFDPRSHGTLVVHARRGNGNDGGVIALSISEFEVVRGEDEYAPVTKSGMDTSLLSNPVRKEFPDDNGANDHGD
jgi:hypothetical protein